jgi:hypothetical protein
VEWLRTAEHRNLLFSEEGPATNGAAKVIEQRSEKGHTHFHNSGVATLSTKMQRGVSAIVCYIHVLRHAEIMSSASAQRAPTFPFSSSNSSTRHSSPVIAAAIRTALVLQLVCPHLVSHSLKMLLFEVKYLHGQEAFFFRRFLDFAPPNKENGWSSTHSIQVTAEACICVCLFVCLFV